MSRNFCGRKFPYAAVTAKSISNFRNAFKNASSFAFSGHKIRSSVIPRCIASSATGDGAGASLLRPRPRGRPGCDTTAVTSNIESAALAASSMRPSTSLAQSGVPRNTTRDFRPSLVVDAHRTAMRLECAREHHHVLALVPAPVVAPCRATNRLIINDVARIARAFGVAIIPHRDAHAPRALECGHSLERIADTSSHVDARRQRPSRARSRAVPSSSLATRRRASTERAVGRV